MNEAEAKEGLGAKHESLESLGLSMSQGQFTGPMLGRKKIRHRRQIRHIIGVGDSYQITLNENIFISLIPVCVCE